MSILRHLVIVSCFAILAASPAVPATIHVPGDQPTIQSGLNASGVGDTVLVACGTYQEHDVILRSGVTLRSVGGDPSCVTIDAQGIGRILIGEGLASGTRIEGFTLTGSGLVPFWGAVLCRGGQRASHVVVSLTISHRACEPTTAASLCSQPASSHGTSGAG